MKDAKQQILRNHKSINKLWGRLQKLENKVDRLCDGDVVMPFSSKDVKCPEVWPKIEFVDADTGKPRKDESEIRFDAKDFGMDSPLDRVWVDGVEYLPADELRETAKKQQAVIRAQDEIIDGLKLSSEYLKEENRFLKSEKCAQFKKGTIIPGINKLSCQRKDGFSGPIAMDNWLLAYDGVIIPGQIGVMEFKDSNHVLVEFELGE